MEDEEVRDQIAAKILPEFSLGLEFQRDLDFIAKSLIKSDEDKDEKFNIIYNYGPEVVNAIENLEGCNIRNKLWLSRIKLDIASTVLFVLVVIIL